MWCPIRVRFAPPFVSDKPDLETPDVVTSFGFLARDWQPTRRSLMYTFLPHLEETASVPHIQSHCPCYSRDIPNAILASETRGRVAQTSIMQECVQRYVPPSTGIRRVVKTRSLARWKRILILGYLTQSQSYSGLSHLRCHALSKHSSSLAILWVQLRPDRSSPYSQSDVFNG